MSAMPYQPTVWDRCRPHSEGRRPAPKPQKMGVPFVATRPPVAVQEEPEPVEDAPVKSAQERRREAARRYYERHRADVCERARKRYAARNEAAA